MANLPKRRGLKPAKQQNEPEPANRIPDGSIGPFFRRDVRHGPPPCSQHPLGELTARAGYPEAVVVPVGMVAAVVGCATALSGRGAPSGTAGSRMS